MVDNLHSLNVCFKGSDFMDIRLHKQRLFWNFAGPLRIPSYGGTPDFSIVAESVLRPLRPSTSGAFFVPLMYHCLIGILLSSLSQLSTLEVVYPSRPWAAEGLSDITILFSQ